MINAIRKILNHVHWLCVLIFDSIVITTSYWLGHKFWLMTPHRFNPNPPMYQISDVFIFSIIIIIALIAGGTYQPYSSVFHVIRLKNLLKYSGIGFIITVIISFFSKSLLVGRLQTLYTIPFLFILLIFERSIVDGLWNKFITRKLQLKRIVVFGAGDTGKRLVKSMEKHPKLGYKAVAFFDDSKLKNSVIMANPLPVLGGKDAFIRYLKRVKDKIDGVFIAMPGVPSEETRKIMEICDDLNVDYKFVPSMNELAMHQVRQEQLDGIPLFGRKELKLPLISRIIKRIFDILFSAGILICLSPILAVIALTIKLDSKGPAIFKQKRIGLDGSEFILYKFRTMFQETLVYGVHPFDRDDPRVTRAGRYLRRTSLDELPQFWNVLKGPMSVVGPRPEMPFIVEQYNETHRERLNVKPGITGLWQISGDRSLPIHENIDHDLYYIENQSLLLDIIIILQTVWFGLVRGIGAK